MTPSAELIIKVQLSKSDITRAILQRSLRKPLSLLTPIWVVVIVKALLASQPHSWAWACTTGVIVLVAFPFSVSRSCAKRPGVLEPIIYTFSSDGVTADFVNGTNRAAWSLVKGARESGDFFLIEMQRNSFHVIPKRFIDEVESVQLRSVLQKNVSKNVRLSS